MGADFDLLPPQLRRLHGGAALFIAVGEAEVTRGRGPLARLTAMLFGLPPAGTHSLRFTIVAAGGSERWRRDFGGHRLQSRMTGRGRRLVEAFGAWRFSFELAGDADGLAMRLTGWSFAHLPLPLGLAPRIAAREWQHDDTFRFAISVALPTGGEIIGYSGWLRL